MKLDQILELIQANDKAIKQEIDDGNELEVSFEMFELKRSFYKFIITLKICNSD